MESGLVVVRLKIELALSSRRWLCTMIVHCRKNLKQWQSFFQIGSCLPACLPFNTARQWKPVVGSCFCWRKWRSGIRFSGGIVEIRRLCCIVYGGMVSQVNLVSLLLCRKRRALAHLSADFRLSSLSDFISPVNNPKVSMLRIPMWQHIVTAWQLFVNGCKTRVTSCTCNTRFLTQLLAFLINANINIWIFVEIIQNKGHKG